MPSDFDFARLVNVPGKGVVLFSQESQTDYITAISLADFHENWKPEPRITGRRGIIIEGSCVLQLNQTRTIFLGGHKHKRKISSFDWLKNKFIYHDTLLLSEHSHGSCAVVNDELGNNLVAVVGNYISDGTLLEIWNPHNESIHIESMPPESNETLTHGMGLVAVNHGKDIFFYGGSNSKQILK